MELLELARVLRERRESIGISKAKIARRVEVSESFVAMAEQGSRRPSKAVLERWASALGLDAASTRQLLALAGHITQEQDGTSLSRLPFTAGAMHFPQPRRIEVGWVIQQLLGVLKRAEISEKDWQETLQHLESFFGWLKFRLGGEVPPAENIVNTLEQGEFVGTLILNWKKEQQAHRTLKEAEEWEEKWTRVVEEEGDFFIVMKGIQGWTLPQGYYDEQVKPILERGGEGAEFIRHALACRERRRVAFERQVRRYKFRHIMPIGALELYKQTGFHRPDEWVRIFKGNRVPHAQQAEHIRHIIGLLEADEYKNYELGLLTGEAGETDLYNHFFWEIKIGHTGRTVVLEDLTLGEQDFIIKDSAVVDDFCRQFDTLWQSEEVIKDKKQVKSLLEKHIESLVKSSAIS